MTALLETIMLPIKGSTVREALACLNRKRLGTHWKDEQLVLYFSPEDWALIERDAERYLTLVPRFPAAAQPRTFAGLPVFLVTDLVDLYDDAQRYRWLAANNYFLPGMTKAEADQAIDKERRPCSSR